MADAGRVLAGSGTGDQSWPDGAILVADVQAVRREPPLGPVPTVDARYSTVQLNRRSPLPSWPCPARRISPNRRNSARSGGGGSPGCDLFRTRSAGSAGSRDGFPESSRRPFRSYSPNAGSSERDAQPPYGAGGHDGGRDLLGRRPRAGTMPWALCPRRSPSAPGSHVQLLRLAPSTTRSFRAVLGMAVPIVAQEPAPASSCPPVKPTWTIVTSG
jgi:hypothetical protein